MAVLKKLDYFRDYKVDPRTRTNFGGCLTLIIPVLLAGYIAWKAFLILTQPLNTNVQVVTDQNTIFKITLKCTAQGGCFYTQNYVSESACTDLLIDRGFEFAGRCTYLKEGEEINVPFCYTADPIDGPAFIWKRLREDSVCQTANPPPQCIQSAGVTLFVNYLQLNGNDIDSIKTVSNGIELFYGVHALSIVNSTVVGRPEYETIQASPVLVSSESEIDFTNLCCPNGGTTAYYNGVQNVDVGCDTSINGSGNANDVYTLSGSNLVLQEGLFYQLKLRSFPTFINSQLSKEEILTSLISSIGGVYQVILGVLTGMVISYRWVVARK